MFILFYPKKENGYHDGHPFLIHVPSIHEKKWPVNNPLTYSHGTYNSIQHTIQIWLPDQKLAEARTVKVSV